MYPLGFGRGWVNSICPQKALVPSVKPFTEEWAMGYQWLSWTWHSWSFHHRPFSFSSWVWRYMTIITALVRQRQGDWVFKAIVIYKEVWGSLSFKKGNEQKELKEEPPASEFWGWHQNPRFSESRIQALGTFQSFLRLQLHHFSKWGEA